MNLKHILITILFLTSLIFYYNLTDLNPKTTTAQVTKIIDGDTLQTSANQTIRLLGINTPEKNEPFYQEAKTHLNNLVQNQTIQIESEQQDKYGRTLAYIFLNNQNVNAQILKQGLATLYYYDHDSHYEELKKAEEFARLNQLGIWEPSPNAPCIQVTEFKTTEPESLTLQNTCPIQINLTYKDDATHIYKTTLSPDSIYQNNFSHTWNTEGDSIYIYDNQGLILFQRY
ncbi:thermonuclease family protein [Candidatus Pacearchaeota archaeon]|nr:thermonuclease family protein [Candidatus Pacearchaeota archaeon]